MAGYLEKIVNLKKKKKRTTTKQMLLTIHKGWLIRKTNKQKNPHQAQTLNGASNFMQDSTQLHFRTSHRWRRSRGLRWERSRHWGKWGRWSVIRGIILMSVRHAGVMGCVTKSQATGGTAGVGNRHLRVIGTWLHVQIKCRTVRGNWRWRV